MTTLPKPWSLESLRNYKAVKSGETVHDHELALDDYVDIDPDKGDYE